MLTVRAGHFVLDRQAFWLYRFSRAPTATGRSCCVRSRLFIVVRSRLPFRAASATQARASGRRSCGAASDGVAAKHEIFVATTRKKARGPASVFDRRRSDMLSFARVGVTVPKDHEIGAIERAKDGDPAIRPRISRQPTSTIYDSAPAFTKAVAE